MRRTVLPSVVLLLLASACTGRPEPDAPAAARDSAQAAPPPPDSLVLELSDGSTVWYTMGREARAADGTDCIERTLEIRRGGNRIAVPLLYTRDVPVEVNDTTLEARVYLGCSPGDRYRIDSRTGLPTPIR